MASSDDALFAQVGRRFGLAGPVRPLPGERTHNALLMSADGLGRSAVVKIHPVDERPDVELEIAALRHLRDAGLAARVPVPVPTPGGAELLELDTPDGPRLARALTWLPGSTWAGRAAIGGTRAAAGAETALAELGRLVAAVDRALAGFDHPHADRPLAWNLARADQTLARVSGLTEQQLAPERRAVAAAVLERFRDEVRPALDRLPAQVIHNDANDANIVLDDDGRVTGLIDFGDLCRAPRVCGLAVAAAYALAGLDDPDPDRLIRAVLPLVTGYHEVAPLQPGELALLLPLVRTRLAVSTVMAGWQSARDPGNEYLLVSQAAVWSLQQRLAALNDRLTLCRLRQAVGYEPDPASRAVRAQLLAVPSSPVLGVDLAAAAHQVLDWSAGSDWAGSASLPPATIGIGRYAEHRAVYATPAFETGAVGPDREPERRTVHLGVDLFAPEGSPVHAPQDGVVHQLADNAAPLDYGPVVILRHELDAEAGSGFFTLYGHLSRDTLRRLRIGQPVGAGERFASIGGSDENGGWAPHVHVQVLTDLLGLGVDVPGVAPASDLPLWTSVSPDPNLILGLPEGVAAQPVSLTAEQLGRRRTVSLSPALSVSYAQPLHLVDGRGAYLYDPQGRGWLDLVNNVAHVGHAHPRVVAAAAAQQARLNTNTRYLHELVLEYARRLVATLPDPLSVCFLVNSGSEANDLALRLAYTHTRARDVLVLDHAYHGNLVSLVDVSPYKFDGPGGLGSPPTTHVVPLPDPYRGRYRTAPGEPSSSVTAAYLAEVDARLDAVAAVGRRVAAFLSEPMPGTAGQVVLAQGFLAGAYERVRASGGICVADEVQIGFGRPGAHFWGFEAHGVVPDVVTMGKPIGNGHPMAAVVTSPEVAHSFLTGMEYFNTFGGNPVSAAVGLAVLDVVADERLQARAARLGERLLTDLRELSRRHDLVGDVRGTGLFLGVALVRDRLSRTPARDAASAVVEAVKRRGVLISSDGPDHNVLKLKPPMVLSESDCDRFVTALDEALTEVSSGT